MSGGWLLLRGCWLLNVWDRSRLLCSCIAHREGKRHGQLLILRGTIGSATSTTSATSTSATFATSATSATATSTATSH